MFFDLVKVLPFWSTRLKSGADSPTARLSAEDCLDIIDVGANADALVAKAVMSEAEIF